MQPEGFVGLHDMRPVTDLRQQVRGVLPVVGNVEYGMTSTKSRKKNFNQELKPIGLPY